MATNKTLLEILASREDVSDYLFHFTKGANAKDTLIKILSDGRLLDVSNKGVICFTEAPLNSMVKMFDIFGRYSSPYYAPYGVAIKKELLYSLGARPVIYGDDREKNLIDKTMQWRFELYDPARKDFTWLREWRINSSDVLLDKVDCFVVVKNQQDLLEVTHEMGDIQFDGCVSDGRFFGSAYADVKLIWKGISLEGIKMDNLNEKLKIGNDINAQNIGDEYSAGLGGVLF